jgi:hypothetical protein
MVMSKQTQMGFFPSSTSTKNQVLILEGFNQLNQTEEPAIMELDNEINIQEPPLTCKNCIQNNGKLLRYYSIELLKILAIIEKISLCNKQGRYFDNK